MTIDRVPYLPHCPNMSKRELVQAYIEGGIGRREFLRKLIAAGVTAGAALTYVTVLSAEKARAGRNPSTHSPFSPSGPFDPSGPIPGPVQDDTGGGAHPPPPPPPPAAQPEQPEQEGETLRHRHRHGGRHHEKHHKRHHRHGHNHAVVNGVVVGHA